MTNKLTSCLRFVWEKIKQSQIIWHLFLFTTTMIWSTCYIFWKPTLKEMNIFVFSFIRISLLVFTLAPLAFFTDIKYRFFSERQRALEAKKAKEEALKQKLADEEAKKLKELNIEKEPTLLNVAATSAAANSNQNVVIDSNLEISVTLEPHQHATTLDASLHDEEDSKLAKVPLTQVIKEAKVENIDDSNQQQHNQQHDHLNETSEADVPRVKEQVTFNGIVSFVLHYLWDKCPGPRTHLKFALSGILIVIINQLFFSEGLKLTSPIITAIMQQLSPVWTCGLSLILRLEERSILKVIGILFAVAGSVLTLVLNNFTTGSKGGQSFEFSWNAIIGVVCFLISTFGYACYLLMQRHMLNQGIPPFTVTLFAFGYGLLFGTIAAGYSLVDFCMHSITTISREAWFGAVYGAVIGGTVAFTLQTIASKHLTPTIVSIYSTILPIASALLSYFILNDVISPFCIFGAVLITIGVLLVAIARYREGRKAKSTVLPKTTADAVNLGSSGKPVDASEEKVKDQQQEHHEEEANAVSAIGYREMLTITIPKPPKQVEAKPVVISVVNK